ncbi:MAG TPA: 5-formyltetrahydrofolate cyclo-ligase [Telmatospirillum sp.]|nr:5-formyltetrahydrofolate cyclo-ligase [Telmatospirillum sp.]
MRRQAVATRREAHQCQKETAGERIASVFLATVPWRAGMTVAGYWPMSDEADVRPLLTILSERDCPVALPVVVAKDDALRFRLWRPGMPLDAGRYGTLQPPPDSPLVMPDLLLIPLLAFDRRGGRLGYGGGYYDRTLASLRIERHSLAVGIAYAAQEFPELPHEPHDQRLDWIVTETAAQETLP